MSRRLNTLVQKANLLILMEDKLMKQKDKNHKQTWALMCTALWEDPIKDLEAFQSFRSFVTFLEFHKDTHLHKEIYTAHLHCILSPLRLDARFFDCKGKIQVC